MPTVKSRIAEAAAEMKANLISHLSNINHVATTTDCGLHTRKATWVSRAIGLMGRTCVVLACKRLQGWHTFDVLAGVLDDIHCHYRIRGKVVRTTTNSGSNFVKVILDTTKVCLSLLSRANQRMRMPDQIQTKKVQNWMMTLSSKTHSAY